MNEMLPEAQNPGITAKQNPPNISRSAPEKVSEPNTSWWVRK